MRFRVRTPGPGPANLNPGPDGRNDRGQISDHHPASEECHPIHSSDATCDGGPQAGVTFGFVAVISRSIFRSLSRSAPTRGDRNAFKPARLGPGEVKFRTSKCHRQLHGDGNPRRQDNTLPSGTSAFAATASNAVTTFPLSHDTPSFRSKMYT
jgi:hypothetical protein